MTVLCTKRSSVPHPRPTPTSTGKHCIECDVEIHPGRLALKKVKCIECQEATEKRNAHTRK